MDLDTFLQMIYFLSSFKHAKYKSTNEIRWYLMGSKYTKVLQM